MNGPFHLQSERHHVPVNTVGVYWLAHRQTGPIRRVGSTPDGGTLRKRLGNHASDRIYSWFWFEVAPTPDHALQRECVEYVNLRPADNKIRPPHCRLQGHRH